MTDSVPILMYHSVADEPVATVRRLSVTPPALEEQLSFLANQGFTGLTFAELSNAFETGATLPERPVVLTFDDGYADFAEHAWPILRRFSFPATVFVTSGWIDDAGPDRAGVAPARMLTWAQVRELASSGVEIGAHSHSHPELDQLSDAALRTELHIGRALLEEHIGAPVRTLAYPFGYSSRRVRLAARTAGFRSAASVRNLRATRSDDLFLLPRLTIRRSTDHADFTAIVSGAEGPVLRRDRILTAGYASVRCTRRAAKWVRSHA